MAKEVLEDISRTFDEFLLVPGLTTKKHTPDQVSLLAPLSESLSLNIPIVSASMQAVSGPRLAIALARKGGSAVIFCSQSIDSQALMVAEVKEHKAGFVKSDANLSPEHTLADAVAIREKTGHSTIAITEGGLDNGRLLGILTRKDFWEYKDNMNSPIKNHYTPIEKLVYAKDGSTLQDATNLLWKAKKECVPIVDKDMKLKALVFRRDYFDHKLNPLELTDANKRLVVGAAVNTHDYRDRVPALLSAGADFLCIDSSDGYSEWQRDTIEFIKNYQPNAVVGAGNVVSKDGFDYLVEAGASFIKVGIGGGSICITREAKGIGRGQASALLEVSKARDDYFAKTGKYIPICSDGGIRNDTHVILALAMGADFVMMGKYFAMTDESPPEKFTIQGRLYKPYWGEGANRARNWQRYSEGLVKDNLQFEEGVDAYVPYSGSLSEKVDITLKKITHTFCNLGSLNISEFHRNAVLTRISHMTFVEGGTSSVMMRDKS